MRSLGAGGQQSFINEMAPVLAKDNSLEKAASGIDINTNSSWGIDALA